jgi:hypothetical protein
MHIRVGYELIYHCPQETPMLLLVTTHSSRASDIVLPDSVTTDPAVPITAYHDAFGNWCTRLVAPAGQMRVTSCRAPACGGGFACRDARLPAREPLL